jgi:hypothetical protein
MGFEVQMKVLRIGEQRVLKLGLVTDMTQHVKLPPRKRYRLSQF